MRSAVGLIGLGMMGKNLALNLANKGYALSLYNRPEPKLGNDIAIKLIDKHKILKTARGFEQLEPFVDSLEKPRKILIMIKSGEAVDQVLGSLMPLLDVGDVIVEGGNSFFRDTTRRQETFEKKGIHYLGTGVSGGIRGALEGLSIMPGGSVAGYALVKEILHSISAKTKAGDHCVSFIGKDGAGHFVKMVHNGIEYAEMQLLAETYDLLKNIRGLNPDQIADIFSNWMKDELQSYLLDISIKILREKEDDGWLVDKIIDRANGKGTGGWNAQLAGELGVPLPSIVAAVFQRFQSMNKKIRLDAEKLYNLKITYPDIDVDKIGKAFQAARIINHHQGFRLIELANKTFGWDINLSELANIWTNGCVIQSALMNNLVEDLKEKKPLLSSSRIVPLIKDKLSDFKETVTAGLSAGIPLAVYSACLNYLLAYVQGDSPANLIQAQRDYFGAHTFQRTDDPTGKSIHYNWTKSSD